jgi:hypothetical protein
VQAPLHYRNNAGVNTLEGLKTIIWDYPYLTITLAIFTAFLSYGCSALPNKFLALATGGGLACVAFFMVITAAESIDKGSPDNVSTINGGVSSNDIERARRLLESRGFNVDDSGVEQAIQLLESKGYTVSEK